jgi:hypothetical protein
MNFPIYGKIENVPNHQPVYNSSWAIGNSCFTLFNPQVVQILSHLCAPRSNEFHLYHPHVRSKGANITPTIDTDHDQLLANYIKQLVMSYYIPYGPMATLWIIVDP